ncbi:MULTISPECIES: hypothetical protein [unclassified Streptomyces]|nr:MULTISPECIES: hypothetical protein [unclassified Streptomyces]
MCASRGHGVGLARVGNVLVGVSGIDRVGEKQVEERAVSPDT